MCCSTPRSLPSLNSVSMNVGDIQYVSAVKPAVILEMKNGVPTVAATIQPPRAN